MTLWLSLLGRVLYSWIDRTPYPDNDIKRILWAITDPILEPLRRFVPPMGMIDITPIVALFSLQIVYQLLYSALGCGGVF